MLNLRLARPMLIALAACAANFLVQGSALADDAQENKALKEQMRQMMQRMDALQKFYNTVGITLAAAGLLSPILAAAAMLVLERLRRREFPAPQRRVEQPNTRASCLFPSNSLIPTTSENPLGY